MHIAIVINTSWNIYNFRMGLIQSFIARGWKVTAIAPKDDFSKELLAVGCAYEEVPMQNKGSNPLSDFLLFLKLLKVYKKTSPDVILHYTIKPNIYGTLAAGALKIPCISNVSGLGTVFIRKNFISKIALLLYKMAFRYPKLIFFQNNDDCDLFVQHQLCGKEKTAVLPGSGINLNAFAPLPYKRPVPFTFLMIARLLYDKGILEYVAAARVVKAQYPEVRFKLLGFIEDTGGLGVTRQMVGEWEKEGLIDYEGSTADVKPYINAAGCVVLPSYREGTPRTLLEALALAKPIIATDVPGCKETVVDGQNGYLCEVKNAQSLAEKMLQMLPLPEVQLMQMAQKSRTLAEDKFDERLVISAYHSAILKTNSSYKQEITN